jgi:catechol 2,3-dioxygenase-like lactoylglutathione lyase family enzyme
MSSLGFIVNIDVPDLAAAERFYCDGLGLSPGRRFGGGMLELLGGPTPVYLLEKPAASKAVPDGGATRDYGRHWTPLHLDFLTADIDAALARAVAAGAVLERPIRDETWGRIALFADPFGNGFCLVQFTARGYDEIAEAAD